MMYAIGCGYLATVMELPLLQCLPLVHGGIVVGNVMMAPVKYCAALQPASGWSLAAHPCTSPAQERREGHQFEMMISCD